MRSPLSSPRVFLLTNLRLDESDVPILVTGDADVKSRPERLDNGRCRDVWFYSEPLSKTHWTGRWDQAPGGPILFIASTEPPDRKLAPEERRTSLQTIESHLVNLNEP